MAAVKIALPSLLSNEERAAGWFHREMAIARELVHPHIVRWYDSGAAEDTIFFATVLSKCGGYGRLWAHGNWNPPYMAQFAYGTTDPPQFGITNSAACNP